MKNNIRFAITIDVDGKTQTFIRNTEIPRFPSNKDHRRHLKNSIEDFVFGMWPVIESYFWGTYSVF